MKAGADIVFKNRDPQKFTFDKLHVIGKNSVGISSSSGDFGIDLLLSTQSLKELNLLISEHILRGCDIDNRKRLEGMESAEAQVKNCYFNLAGENLTVQVEDSKDMEYSDFVLALTTKGGEWISLNITVKQARDIAKVLKQFVLSFELNRQAHRGRSSATLETVTETA